MKTWWKAVCDEHKEMCEIFVNNVHVTSKYLSEGSDVIEDFMKRHRACKLRLVHDDVDLGECHAAGYKNMDVI